MNESKAMGISWREIKLYNKESTCPSNTKKVNQIAREGITLLEANVVGLFGSYDCLFVQKAAHQCNYTASADRVATLLTV